MSEEINEQVVFPTEGEILNSLLVKYGEELTQTVTQIEEQLKRVSQNLKQLEQNSIAARAQLGLINKVKEDVKSVKESAKKNNERGNVS